MSRIDKLVATLCPRGVEFKALGDIAKLVRGNGLPKSDFTESGVGCIHYGQIYTHYGVSATETISFVSPQTATPLAKVEPSDLIITNTSENVEDVCKSVAWLGKTQIVTGGHATVIKHGQDARFLSYYFRTPEFFAQKKKHAVGTKVIDVSAKNLAKIRVPVPPLEIQREIVKVLDAFTELEADLEAYLEARRKQYKHYRDSLLTSDARVKFKLLGELGKRNKGTVITAGRMKSIQQDDGPIRVFAGGQTIADVSKEAVPTKDVVRVPSIIVKSRGHIGFEYYDRPFTHKAELWSYSINHKDANQKFVYYYLLTRIGRLQEIARANSVKLPQLGVADTDTLFIPLPPLEIQREIVKVLDNFTELEAELEAELDAELEARRKQYHHYRDRLLTFEAAA